MKPILTCCLCFVAMTSSYISHAQSDSNGFPVDSGRFRLIIEPHNSWGNGNTEGIVQYNIAMEMEKRITATYSLNAMARYGTMNQFRNYGVELTVRRYGKILGFDGWYAGLAYNKPSESKIRLLYDYKTVTFLDAMHVAAGLFAGLSGALEVSLGMRFSITHKWMTYVNYLRTYRDMAFHVSIAYRIW